MDHRTTPRTGIALFTLMAAASGQVQEGDVLLNLFVCDQPGSAVQHYRPDGTFVATTSGGSGTCYEGATLTRSGLFLTSRRLPDPGLNLFNQAGDELASFDTPEVFLNPADTAVFADGTLAVADQFTDDVELYAEDGQHLGTITDPSLSTAFSLFVDHNDELWVSGPSSGGVWRFDRQGNLLGSFVTLFGVGDLVVAPDDTVWLTVRFTGDVRHFAADGTDLGGFSTAVQGHCYGLARAADGTFFVAGINDTVVRRYDENGTLLGSFDIVGTGSPTFLTVVADARIGAGFCTSTPNSTGAPALITATGSASLSDDNLVLRAEPVPNQPFVFFHGPQQQEIPFGNGFLCAGGGLTRILPPGAASGNVAERVVDLAAAGITSPGERQFQCWFRDPAGGGAQFDTSNGLSLSFVP